MFKYEIRQTIYFIRHYKVVSGRVISRIRVDNEHDGSEKHPSLRPWGEACIVYQVELGGVQNGFVMIDEAFARASKQELIESL